MFRFLLLVGSVMMTSTSMAGGVSQCSIDTVPIQITDDARRSDDARYGPVTTLSAVRISDPHFRAFVTTVTEHVAARLAKENLCLNSAESKERSLLQFVNWPLVTANPLAPIERLSMHPSSGCRITSPWIDIAIERKPVPWVRGIVRWNERQLLADQAALAGAQNVPLGVAKPLTRTEFESAAWDYGDYGDYDYSSSLPEPAVKLAKERTLPDLMWLFRRSSRTRAPFIGNASRSLNVAMEKGSEGYTKLVIALIDRCFASDGANLHYDSILDAADLIPLEQYKIETLAR
jgi:hypothetical protein